MNDILSSPLFAASWFSVDVLKRSSTAWSSQEGALVTSTTASAPSTALASPSPVIVLTPVPPGGHANRLDVGINPIRDQGTGKVRLVGDIDTAEVGVRAEAITAVPGGVGPITDVWLLRKHCGRRATRT